MMFVGAFGHFDRSLSRLQLLCIYSDAQQYSSVQCFQTCKLIGIRLMVIYKEHIDVAINCLKFQISMANLKSIGFVKSIRICTCKNVTFSSLNERLAAEEVCLGCVVKSS